MIDCRVFAFVSINAENEVIIFVEQPNVNSLKLFTNIQIYDIIKTRNKPNMAFRSIFLYKGYSAFLRPQRLEFGKKYEFRLCGYGLSPICQRFVSQQ
jgi:hypothetical protein